MEQTTENTSETPIRKKKADKDRKKQDGTKKSKPTFTPKAQATRTLNRTTPSSPRRERMADTRADKDTEQNQTRQDRPVMMGELKDYMGDWTTRLSEKLTKTLTSSLSKDFTDAVSVVASSVATNTKNIDQMSSAIKKIQQDTTSSTSKLEQKIERLESIMLASRTTSRSDDEQRNEQNTRPPIMDLMQVDMRVREDNIT